MDLENLKQARHTVTGTKQTQKAVDCDRALHVFVARDADERVTKPIVEACRHKEVPVTMVETMEDLGKACNIKVSAATAAIVLED